MILEVINVDHGACALITTSNGSQLMIDCGHHVERRWWPGSALAMANIRWLDRLFITNFDEDHASGMANLQANVGVSALVTNPTIGVATLRDIKSKGGGIGPGISALADSMEHVFTGGTPLPTDFGDTSFSVYYHPYNALTGFSDTNNLSLVVFVTCGRHKIIFPGDLEKPGWKAHLRNPDFVRELWGVTLFIASHHGRENGYCEDVMDLCPNINAVIFSDKKKGYQTQETVELYRRHAQGLHYDGQLRRVLTTRRDKSMRFALDPMGGGLISLRHAA
ncbi:ComEC/Rec2 family competence protein [Thioclava nitratireducens]|uniref:ComEC/Rec2 family competence protein n=1 Tax=Thioclava nitratireducens TaxID=1915078 RepID=UPI002481872E|nr:hypothetical protein [Thioclava nitratireducens]WGT48659.1 hypothetical protein P0N61_09975 [Thioclava nitratireducens]